MYSLFQSNTQVVGTSTKPKPQYHTSRVKHFILFDSTACLNTHHTIMASSISSRLSSLSALVGRHSGKREKNAHSMSGCHRASQRKGDGQEQHCSEIVLLPAPFRCAALHRAACLPPTFRQSYTIRNLPMSGFPIQSRL